MYVCVSVTVLIANFIRGRSVTVSVQGFAVQLLSMLHFCFKSSCGSSAPPHPNDAVLD